MLRVMTNGQIHTGPEVPGAEYLSDEEAGDYLRNFRPEGEEDAPPPFAVFDADGNVLAEVSDERFWTDKERKAIEKARQKHETGNNGKTIGNKKK